MKVYSAYQDGQLTVYLQGELDHHGVKNSMCTIERLLDQYLPRDCALDMSGLNFMDSSGIALILKLHARQKENGGRAWVQNPSGQPMRVIDTSGIERLVKINVKEGAKV